MSTEKTDFRKIKFFCKKCNISVHQHNQCFSASNHPPAGGTTDKIVVYGWKLIRNNYENR
ncbi:MAG: hypothetical protein U9P79_10710 [Candidatus Cloacimonadota bacterium]|nr:hypothetical protein [Candidatus Cloacimonadota bacterium]